MPNAHASSTSSIERDGKHNIDTMTSGNNSSAAATSTNKAGESFFETSKTTTDKDGNTHTTKTSGRGDAGRGKEHQTTSEDPDEDNCDKANEADGQEGVFSIVGHTFASAGGAIAGVKDGKAMASTT